MRRPQSTDPTAPRLNLRVVLWVGTALWALALAAVGVVELVGRSDARLAGICAAGVVLGFLGLDWERRNARG